jgi:hypothetical protein
MPSCHTYSNLSKYIQSCLPASLRTVFTAVIELRPTKVPHFSRFYENREPKELTRGTIQERKVFGPLRQSQKRQSPGLKNRHPHEPGTAWATMILIFAQWMKWGWLEAEPGSHIPRFRWTAE